jgi:hypothetical protein
MSGRPSFRGRRANPPMQWTEPAGNFLSFESRRGAGSATDWPYVSEQRGASPILETYRAFPRFQNPRAYRRLDPAGFESLTKNQIHTGASLCAGHVASTLWCAGPDDSLEYVVQVKLEGRPDVCVVTPCSHAPTWGVDVVDGFLAEDAEHLVLHEQLGFETNRLTVFGDADDVDPIVYLKERGFLREEKKWWQFWR